MAQRLAIVIAILCLLSGCHLLPIIEHQPTYHNPFPQLMRVGVAPFYNLSAEGTLDGRQVALAYFNELQAIPGFEVTPVGIIELKARELGLDLSSYDNLRLVANKLNLDAIVVGAITDFTPYYPPRMSLQVDWIAANPGFHPIPTGYGLPWGTPLEEEIPQTLVQAAEFELAREQLKTQTPNAGPQDLIPVPTSQQGAPEGVLAMLQSRRLASTAAAPTNETKRTQHGSEEKVSASGQPAGSASEKPLAQSPTASQQPQSADSISQSGDSNSPLSLAQYHAAAAGSLPADWPDPRGFIPPTPTAERPVLRPSQRPVLTHTRNYNGHDSEFTRALENYMAFRDDARFGGWQGYLQRSDDFIRFCCHMHLTEMLTARGGASETRVVWRWANRR